MEKAAALEFLCPHPTLILALPKGLPTRKNWSRNWLPFNASTKPCNGISGP